MIFTSRPKDSALKITPNGTAAVLKNSLAVSRYALPPAPHSEMSVQVVNASQTKLRNGGLRYESKSGSMGYVNI